MEPRSRYGIAAKPVTLVAQLLGIAISALVLVWCIHFRGGLAFDSSNKALIFNIHPVLMFIGFIFVASEAILAFKIIPGTRQFQKAVHLVLQGVAAVLAAVGIYAAFKFHNESNIDNLYSLHSWVGLFAVCLFALQWLGGFVAFVYPGASKSGRAALVPWHAFLGLFIYVTAIGAAEIGFLEKMTFLEMANAVDRHSSEAKLVNSTGLLLLVFGMTVVLAAVLP